MIQVFKQQNGFTFVEAIVSLLVLAILVSGLFLCLTFSAGSAARAKEETAGNMRVIKTIEQIIHYPYEMVTTNYFPVEYVTGNDGSLVYALTTTITEVTLPTIHKNIIIDHTWKEDKVIKQKRYYYIKPK